jgi:hypothetical protein
MTTEDLPINKERQEYTGIPRVGVAVTTLTLRKELSLA